MGRRHTAGAVGNQGVGGLQVDNTIMTAADNLDITIDPSGTGIFKIAGDAQIQAQGDLRFADSDSSNWVAFQAPATIASDVTWTLPNADGSASQLLSTNGSGVLSWSTAGISVTDNTSDSATHYVTITTASSGTITSARVSTTKLSFQPSTGLLSVAAISGYASAVTLTADNSTNATRYPLFSDALTGNVSPRTDDGYTYNPSTGELTAVILTASSDISTKENIETISDALDKVKELRGVSYVRKENKIAEIGVLAQEVEQVIPSIVRGTEGNKSVAYGNLVALLIEAIKEQQEQIDELKGRFVQCHQ